MMATPPVVPENGPVAKAATSQRGFSFFGLFGGGGGASSRAKTPPPADAAVAHSRSTPLPRDPGCAGRHSLDFGSRSCSTPAPPQKAATFCAVERSKSNPAPPQATGRTSPVSKRGHAPQSAERNSNTMLTPAMSPARRRNAVSMNLHRRVSSEGAPFLPPALLAQGRPQKTRSPPLPSGGCMAGGYPLPTSSVTSPTTSPATSPLQRPATSRSPLPFSVVVTPPTSPPQSPSLRGVASPSSSPRNSLQMQSVPTGLRLTLSTAELRIDAELNTVAVYVIDVSVDPGGYIVNSCGVAPGKWQIVRRFNQFYELDIQLHYLFPREKLTRMPRRWFKPGANAQIIKGRMPELQQYLNQVVQNIPISACDFFLKWTSPENDPRLISLSKPDHAGYLIKEGHLVRNWNKRYFILKDSVLVYLRDDKSLSNFDQPKGKILLSGATIRRAPERGALCFEIAPVGVSAYYIRAADEADFVKWFNVIEATVSWLKESALKLQYAASIDLTSPPLPILSSRATRNSAPVAPSSLRIQDPLPGTPLTATSLQEPVVPLDAWVPGSYDLNALLLETKNTFDKKAQEFINDVCAQVVPQGTLRGVLAQAVEITQQVVDMPVETLICNNACKQFLAGLEDMRSKTSGTVNAMLSKLLFLFSPLARAIELAIERHQALPKKARTLYLPRRSDDNTEDASAATSSLARETTLHDEQCNQEQNRKQEPEYTTCCGTCLEHVWGLLDKNPPLSPPSTEIQPPPSPARSRSASVKIICRICEEEYPRDNIAQHTTFCTIAEKLDDKKTSCDNRLMKLLEAMQEHQPSPTKQNAIIMTEIEKMVDVVLELPYEQRESCDKCFKLLQALQQFLEDCADMCVGTFGRRMCFVLEEKWATLTEFQKISALPASQGRLWGAITLNKGQGLTRRNTPPYINTASIASITAPSPLLLAAAGKKRRTVSIDDFSIKKKISGGAFGQVFLAQKKKTKDYYAIKVLKKSDMLRKNTSDLVLSERNILASMQNPFIVKLYYAFQNERYLFLVMEYCNGGDVASLLHNMNTFSGKMARIYSAETVLALECLHSANIVHRDLKPDNLLLTRTGHLQLTDFGLSRVGLMESEEPTDTGTGKPKVVGTPDYLSPEIILGTGHGPAVDWWALGVMIYEFLTGVPPFNDETPELVFQRILNRDIEWDERIKPDARDLIDKLLRSNPEKRLGHHGAAEVKRHPYFRKIKWATLLQESRQTLFVPSVESIEDTSYFEDHNPNQSCSLLFSPPNNFSPTASVTAAAAAANATPPAAPAAPRSSSGSELGPRPM
eukprot:TRINITY_DN308_c0_g1_i5.p1 TRINITY_DN308_c0_g1~~TRINITY_DN308_c0_g1_i5.p1  ORF type:complete len:1333 (+),score=319.09 TRINITY_DN308_c0_g1_i5:117-4001(+)